MYEYRKVRICFNDEYLMLCCLSDVMELIDALFLEAVKKLINYVFEILSSVQSSVMNRRYYLFNCL